MVLYRETPQGGIFQFTALLQKGKRLRWVARCTGPKDYVLFEMDDKHFYRKEVINGKSKELEKKQHWLPKQGKLTFTLQTHITAAGVVQKLLWNQTWTTLDEWQGANFTQGSFGLLVQGKDELGLSHFSFTPQ
jgi:hypothetical protein